MSLNFTWNKNEEMEKQGMITIRKQVEDDRGIQEVLEPLTSLEPDFDEYTLKSLSVTFANFLLFWPPCSLSFFLPLWFSYLEPQLLTALEKVCVGGLIMILRKSHCFLQSGEVLCLDLLFRLVGKFFSFVLTGITFQIKSLYWIFTLG